MVSVMTVGIQTILIHIDFRSSKISHSAHTKISSCIEQAKPGHLVKQRLLEKGQNLYG